ncbi:MAG: radical SAM protein [Candidatus Hydrogenedentota bacterium]|nr:MAG: radical SAM protein [Candidatus Hydrogenedentota bacterium]
MGRLKKWASLFRRTPQDPAVLNIFTTEKCNFSCHYCSRELADDVPGIDHRYQGEGFFRQKDLEVLLERYPGIKEVDFVGIGEPFLVPELFPMARCAKNAGKRTGVITNGSLLHRYWGEIGEVFDIVSVSLHGLNAEELEEVAGVKPALFQRFVENISILVKKEIRQHPKLCVEASVVPLKSDMSRIVRAAEFCLEVGLPKMTIHNYLPYGLNDVEECLFDDDEVEWKVLQDLKERFAGKLEIILPVPIKRNEDEMDWGCRSFFQILRVDALGRVCGCHRIMVPREENGNWRTDSGVWKNEYFERMRRAFRRKEGIPKCCRYCPEAQ